MNGDPALWASVGAVVGGAIAKGLDFAKARQKAELERENNLLGALQHQVEFLLAEAEDHRREMGALWQTLNAQQGENNELHEKLREATRDRNRLQTELEDARGTVERLQAQVNTLQGSVTQIERKANGGGSH